MNKRGIYCHTGIKQTFCDNNITRMMIIKVILSINNSHRVRCMGVAYERIQIYIFKNTININQFMTMSIAFIHKIQSKMDTSILS